MLRKDVQGGHGKREAVTEVNSVFTKKVRSGFQVSALREMRVCGK